MIDTYLTGRFRNTKAGQWRRMGILRGPLVRIRSTSLIWCLCDSIMSRKAAGRRSFRSSDLGYEKTSITLFFFKNSFWLSLLHCFLGYVLQNMFDWLLRFIYYFSSSFFLYCLILLSLVCLALSLDVCVFHMCVCSSNHARVVDSMSSRVSTNE